MSANQARQTQTIDGQRKRKRESDCEVKQRMTTHWDMDYLSREELEEEMARGFGHREAAPDAGKRRHDAADEAEDTPENAFRTGVTLLIVAVVMMVGAALLLQSGGN